ncbi:MAG TPA: Na/Pi cotransporter family protein [Saprospiraceae bacterium]|nr:Na/Pi cotransporter family protein [Lewinellaceae bacterium]HPQ21798.1 Na/Pi cotransporter family protein [Saprospiraceae bacterium]HRX29502.1 Na/Pi cotransporter family protein [Saprospiraceae bacterium]
MDFGFFSIITILGSLAFFIYGMKVMSDGIQRAAGSQLRNILRSMTKNKYLGVLTGFLTTAIVQSSSATTVMTVSFVNAGLITLVESAGVMMGANIGTTITGWIVAILGFKVKLSAYSIPLFAIGLPMMFINKGKFKYWGEFIIGFAILFLGLNYLKDSVPDISGNEGALAWIQNVAQYGIFSRILFVLVGTLITIIVQSSSAAMTITLTLVYTGWLPLDVAAAMILGENIGTTITAEIASVVGNTNAKRSARIHSLFNIIGVSWMIFLMPFVISFLSGFVQDFVHLFEKLVHVKQELTQEQLLNTYTLAAFHTTFNLLNVLLLLPFVNWLVKLAIRTVPSTEEDDSLKIKFINRSSRTPELATIELQKETANFGESVAKMNKFFKNLLNASTDKERKKMLKKIKRYEELSDEMEIAITEYITKLADQEITPKTSKRLRSFLNIGNDLERIGDIYYQISKTFERKMEDSIYFVPEQREGLNELSTKLEQAFRVMEKNLNSISYDNVNKKEALQLEDEINSIRDKLREQNLTMLGDPEYNVQAAMIYNNVFSSLEKIGDHIVNINEAIVGEI